MNAHISNVKTIYKRKEELAKQQPDSYNLVLIIYQKNF